ncbi:type I-E CRISPR-associated protein Cse2/CasB [Catenulispora sp. NL8]|uniref:Type I-E CRISPR-associated protein Cse2/CasB n=1 Tax=Catenulispora pinistramenti TaxID=2705254 RepID=A0ABS5KGN4_9ACTN|nr:type I-E CRISPR-associated protein Cse2/CasB [Catenulispora pinistramenti]MBS2545348.1 type I-E CRISPR-associated protein Cse2/CasB [Catenulispora pinistramenti]
MTTLEHRGRWFWESFDPTSRSAGADLAAIRKGANKAPGDVPGMWQHYRVVVPNPSQQNLEPHPALSAEHATLVIFSLHQQSQNTRMHKSGMTLGKALHQLKKADKFSEDAVDRRVNRMATAGDVTELIEHLRHLISQLRTVAQPLDYNQLVQDLHDWHRPEQRPRIRRAWGSQYYLWSGAKATSDSDAPEQDADGAADSNP